MARKIIDKTPKIELLSEISKYNKLISIKQRKELYSVVSEHLTKSTFDQILSASFVSNSNLAIANILLKKIKDYADYNQKLIASI